METGAVKRRSVRTRQSVNYVGSPADSPASKRMTRKSVLDEKFHDENVKSSAVQPNTPKSSGKPNRKAADDSIKYSPKKLRLNRTPSSKSLESVVSESSPTMSKLESPRSRPARERKPRYSDINLKINIAEKTVKPLKDVKNKEKDSPVFVASSDDEGDSTINSESISKLTSTTLFDDDEDVEGKNLFSFRTPKKKDSMALLAQNTPKTPRHNDSNKGTPRTPKNNRLSEIQNTPTSRPSASKTAKTPRHVREANKKKLTKILNKESESDGDFSTDASDFNADKSSSDDSSDSDEPEAESPPKKPTSVAARILKTPSTKVDSSMPSVRRSMRNKGDFQYVLKSDDYFSGATSKTKTSDHTLDRLKNPRLPHDQLIKMLSNMELSKEHEHAVKGLNKDYKKYFNKWLTLFDEGFTVLLHGFGSKRNLLQNFHKEKLAAKHVIVINGFFPSLTIKDILDSIWVDLLEQSSVSGNPHETVNMIEEEMKQIPALHLFLIVHNIDGTMLRNAKAQNVLSRLASIKNLHMIASIDHINTPLLWNNTKLSNFNFVWFDVTSFLPYTEETAYENSLLIQNSGALELSSMKSVFQSLNKNARGVYNVVVKYQLKHSGNPSYQGMTFKELYSACRENFLVSSDVALKSQLTEFLDHKLAKLKRTIDGAESITIPIKNFLLEQFLSEQN